MQGVGEVALVDLIGHDGRHGVSFAFDFDDEHIDFHEHKKLHIHKRVEHKQPFVRIVQAL